MKMRFGPSLYFANDKVIFDAINHAQVTTDQIRELLYERGIITSAKTSKYELAQYFSRLTADYFDHASIANKLGKISKRERITYTEVRGEVAKAEIIEALASVRQKLEAQDNRLTVSVTGDRIIARLEYDFIDYTEVEFRQVQPRDAVIEFLKDTSGQYVVRSTQNSHVDVVVDQVFTSMNASRETPLKQDRISLEGFADPALRTKFFESLISNIAGHQFVTVTEAFCYKPKGDASLDDDPKEDVEDQPNVVRVTLKGTGVTKSFVIDELYQKGYYIVKVVWRVKPTASLDSDLFELEAQFGEPIGCNEFSYQARSVLIFEEGVVTDKKRTPKSDEQDQIFRLIEASAKAALATLE